MDELFEEHLEIAKALFAQRLPYWCDVFLRPADRAFNAYLNARGQASTYLVLEGFDPVLYSSRLRPRRRARDRQGQGATERSGAGRRRAARTALSAGRQYRGSICWQFLPPHCPPTEGYMNAHPYLLRLAAGLALLLPAACTSPAPPAPNLTALFADALHCRGDSPTPATAQPPSACAPRASKRWIARPARPSTCSTASPPRCASTAAW